MTTEELLSEARRILQVEGDAICSLVNRIDQHFVQAVTILSNARLIAVCGIGKSGLIAQKIASTLSSVGSPAIFLHPIEALHGDIGILTNQDVAVLLSRSGTTQELVQLVPFLKQRAIPIIGILGSSNGYLSGIVDVVLDVSIEREACPWGTIPTASTTAALAMGDALAIVLMQMKRFTIADFARSHPMGQLGRNLTLCVSDVMVRGNAVPQISSDASFREAIIEISRKGLGCVCVIDCGRLVGIITDGDVRRTLQLYEDIRGIAVNDVMTRNPVTIGPDALLAEALAMMEQRQQQINVLPVIFPDGTCIGVIRLHDIVRSTL